MSRKHKMYSILSESEILTFEQIRSTHINETILYAHLSTYNTHEWFVKMRLLSSTQLCVSCAEPMHLIKDKQSVDRLRWACIGCKKRISIRHGSFFFESRLNLVTIAKLMYKLSANLEMLNISHDLDVHRNCVSKWARIILHSVVHYFEIYKVKIGGIEANGTPKIIEMDESLFFKRKYNRGTIREGRWYVGGVERGTRNCFIVPVENRNTETMRRIITDNVFPGTRIITDEWRAYGAAMRSLEFYTHDTINHSVHFVDPEDPEIHTQSVESLWSHSKRALRKKNGINKESEFEHLIKFMWERSVSKFSRFNEIVILFSAFEYNIDME